MAKQRNILDGDCGVMFEKAIKGGYVEGITPVFNDGKMVGVSLASDLARQSMTARALPLGNIGKDK